MNEIFTVAGIGIISAALILLLRQYRQDIAFGVSIASSIVLFLFSVSLFDGIYGNIKELFSLSGIDSEKFEILFRSLGICILTEIASETCKDCGQASISSKIELAGKVIILVCSMPLVSEITKIIKDLINI